MNTLVYLIGGKISINAIPSLHSSSLNKNPTDLTKSSSAGGAIEHFIILSGHQQCPQKLTKSIKSGEGIKLLVKRTGYSHA